jgi:predicted secreted protein
LTWEPKKMNDAHKLLLEADAQCWKLGVGPVIEFMGSESSDTCDTLDSEVPDEKTVKETHHKVITDMTEIFLGLKICAFP